MAAALACAPGDSPRGARYYTLSADPADPISQALDPTGLRCWRPPL